MKLKSIEQIEEQVSNYVNKASKHLYQNKRGDFYTIIPIYDKSKTFSPQYIAKITITPEGIDIRVSKAVNDYTYQYHGNGTPNVIKRSLFPEYEKFKSIPYFKRMRAIIDELQTKISIDSSDFNKNLIKYLNDKVKGTIYGQELIMKIK